jgi:trimeric autotransporter adhesin
VSKFSVRTPSPSMAIALTALFISLGGTGYAATQIDRSPTASAAKKKAKPPANDNGADKKLFNSLIPGAHVAFAANAGSAGTAGSAASAATAAHATTADSATSATNATHATTADSATVASSLTAPTVHALSFGSGWGSSAFTARGPAFSKDAQGYVHLQGAAARISGTETVIGTLPPGFRPGNLVYVTVYTAFDHLGTLLIDENGNITFRSGEAEFVSLEDVSFLAEK